MSVNEQMIEAPAGAVWSILADAHTYAEWVVGAREIRGVEGEWPAPGATFHHTQGLGPLPVIKDSTSVLECEAERRLVIEVRIRPWLVGHVTLTLEPNGRRTRAVMEEHTRAGLLLPLKPLVDRLFGLRNIESLRRLSAAAERRSEALGASRP